MHYYQFNIGDYRSHTAHLDPIEDIAYRRLLDLYYQSEKPIPLDIAEVARLICMRSNYDCITNVLREFFTQTEYGFINKRADKEIAAYHAKSDKAKASIAARWNKPKKNQEDKDDTNVLQTNNERNTKHKTLNINHKPIDKPVRQAKPAITLKTYLQNCMDKSEKPIPESDAIFEYAESVNLPTDLMRIAWFAFKRDNLLSNKKQKDWPATFRNCVKGNWKKVWWVNPSGAFELTSTGRQIQLEMKGSE